MAPELRVYAAIFQKFIMRTVFHDLPLFEHNDAIHLAQGREPVCNRNDRFALHELVQGFLYRNLAFTVQRRGRLVEEEDGGIFEDCARDGDTLALAAGELHPPLAHERLIFPRDIFDEFMRLRELRGFNNFFRCRFGFPVGNVFGNAPVEQKRLLRHHRDRMPQTFLCHRRDINAVNGYPPAIEVVMVEQKADERTFPCPAFADKADALSRLNLQRQVAKHRHLGIVEHKILNGDLSARHTKDGSADGIGNFVRRDDFLETLADFPPCLAEFVEVRTEKEQQSLDTEDDGEDEDEDKDESDDGDKLDDDEDENNDRDGDEDEDKSDVKIEGDIDLNVNGLNGRVNSQLNGRVDIGS